VTRLHRIGAVVLGGAIIAQVALATAASLTGRGNPLTFVLNLSLLLLPALFLAGEVRKGPAPDRAERVRRRRGWFGFGAGCVLALAVPIAVYGPLRADGGDISAFAVAVGGPVVAGATAIAVGMFTRPT